MHAQEVVAEAKAQQAEAAEKLAMIDAKELPLRVGWGFCYPAAHGACRLEAVAICYKVAFGGNFGIDGSHGTVLQGSPLTMFHHGNSLIVSMLSF
eukprot:225969-Pelagomonas_calceolata.AAC.2